MSTRFSVSVSKCYSLLVAADRGQGCNDFREAIRRATLVRGPDGEIDAVTWTSRSAEAPGEHARIGKNIGRIARRAIAGIPRHVFGPDLDDRAPRDIN